MAILLRGTRGTRVAQLYTAYDASGNAQTPVLTAYFLGGAYEVTDGAAKKYYSIAGMTFALNDGTGLQYLLTDHLGSVVAITDSNGTLTSQQRYLPFGQLRTDLNGPRITQTDFAYTGQRAVEGLGLMDYKARFYDGLLGRFISPDTIVSNPLNSQDFNRYSYANNQPLMYIDPSGHTPSCAGLSNYRCKIRLRKWWQANDTGNDGGVPGEGNAAVSPRACNDVNPACGPNYYYGPVDPGIPAGGGGSFGGSAGGLRGGGGDPMDILGIVNYKLSLPPTTIFYQNALVYEEEVIWTPSLTFNNGSPVTLGPNSVEYRSGNVPISNTTYFTSDSFQFGYKSSPLINGWNSITGMSLSTPRIFQPWTFSVKLNDSLRVGNWTLDNAVTFRITARPDQVGAVGGAGLLVFVPAYIYRMLTTGDSSVPEINWGTQ